MINNSRVQVNVVVVEGTSVAALQAGAGHYPETPYPCAQGNVAIAGHRTTYGRPFNRLNDMRPGDRVACSYIPVCGTCRYCSTGHQNLCDAGKNAAIGCLTDGTFRFHDGDEDLGAPDLAGLMESMTGSKLDPETAKLLEQLFVPAEVALLPHLVGEEQLVAANSMSSLNRNLARLVGPVIGGAVVAFGGLAGVVVVDAASFLVAALLIALISRATSDAQPGGGTKDNAARSPGDTSQLRSSQATPADSAAPAGSPRIRTRAILSRAEPTSGRSSASGMPCTAGDGAAPWTSAGSRSAVPSPSSASLLPSRNPSRKDASE